MPYEERGSPLQSEVEPGPPRSRTPKKGETRHSSDKEHRRLVGPWKLGKTLGRGFSGHVKIAKHTVTAARAAVKIVPRNILPSSRMSVNEVGAQAEKRLLGIEREIVIMKLIDHPNILRLYDVLESSNKIYLVMEYVEDGELFEHLVSRGRFTEDEALNFFQQIISGLDYCHRFNICHRDLKPENILLDKDHNIKIADFGMAAWEATDKLLETFCGSPHYAPPEIVAGINYHGSASDIWSCGVTLYAMLTGRLPFDSENVCELLKKVQIGVFEMPPFISPAAQDLISKMLTVNPAQRVTVEEIQRHPWFTRIAPKPQPAHAIPPSRAQMSESFGSPEQLDPEIVANLQTLWGGSEKEPIVNALVSHDQCWEKVFYYLLNRYQQHLVENVGIDDALEHGTVPSGSKPKSKRTPREHIARTAGGAVRSRSRQSINSLTQRSITPRTGSNRTSHLVATRPAPSAPGREAEAYVNRNSRISSAKYEGDLAPSTPRSLRPLPEVPETTNEHHSVRKSSSQISTSTPTEPRHQTVASAVPRILLQEATPSPAHRKQRSSGETKPELPIPKRDVSPSPSPKVAKSPTASIRIPQTEDPAMRRFFHDIVDQLQTMSNRSPNLHEGALGGSAPPSPYLDSDGFESYSGDNQFEDAEEIHAGEFESYEHENSSIESLSSSNQRHGTKRSSGFVLVDDSSRIPSAVNHNPRTRQLSLLRSYRTQGSRTSNKHHKDTTPWNSNEETKHPRDKSSTRSAPSSQRSKNSTMTSNKENSRVSSYYQTSRDLKVNKGKGKAALGLKIHPPALSYDKSSEGSRKSSRSSRRSKGSPSPLSPASLAFSEDNAIHSPKVSWFTNLFSWKTASYRLMSLENYRETLDEARGLLEDLGCVVSIESLEGVEILKCHLGDHSSGSIRPVKFKVECERTNGSAAGHEIQTMSSTSGTTQFVSKSPSPMHQHQTCVILTVEKGSVPAFKAVCNSMRSAWDLDVAPFSSVGLGVTMHHEASHTPIASTSGKAKAY